MCDQSQNKSLSYNLKKLWDHLSRRRRYQFSLLLILMLVSALAEVLSMGAILPFLGVLTAPEKVFDFAFVAKFAETINVTSAQDLVLPLTILFAVAAIIAGTIRTILLWAITKVAFASGADLSYIAYQKTLHQPYKVHVNRNSSEVISSITIKVNSVVFGVLQQVLTLTSSIILLIIISATLIVINPFVAIIAMFSFGISYSFISLISRKKLRINSNRIANEQTKVIKALQEGLGGIRDVILDGTQKLYCNIYHQADVKLRKAQGENVFIAQSPRYFMETTSMVMIAILAYILSQQAEGMAAVLPVLGVLAIGAQRLLPAMQQSYSALSSLQGNFSSLLDTIELLEQTLDNTIEHRMDSEFKFKKSIHFKDVSFQYSDKGSLILNKLNFTIPLGARVGFIGSTGSGKSTTIDLLMGLLSPTKGAIYVDDKDISKNHISNWQSIIAHVPQHIYLTDNSIAENIALGIPRDEIDMNRVQYAAEQAQIAEYIASQPQGYDTYVGEQGIKLSGGQRQRIGIARVLYKNASVLILDEATSAIDSRI